MQLDDLFIKYGTDKGGPHGWGYAPAYQELLEPVRHSLLNVLEIGICGYRDIPNNVIGASLFAWREFFPQAEIYGLDNDHRFIFNDQHRIHTALCDAYNPDELGMALASWGPRRFNLIVDDAVHDPLPQIALAHMLWPLLEVGGIYAIEDVCPYKIMGDGILQMVQVLAHRFPDMDVKSFDTHKAEKLVILQKLP